MKVPGVLAIIFLMGWIGALPAVAHECCHHGHHYNDCGEYDGDCCHGPRSSNQCRNWAPSKDVTGLQTAEGKITQIDYLPGTTADSSMVEVHLQSAGQSQLVRLAPVGYLKQSGLLLREGDTVTVKGYPVAGMDGDLLVATEVRKGEKLLSLRDELGHPAW